VELRLLVDLYGHREAYLGGIMSGLYVQALEAIAEKMEKADGWDYRRCVDLKGDVDTFKELLAVHTCANCECGREKMAA
jgi:hypothetical protein